jgi:hypothetical protein
MDPRVVIPLLSTVPVDCVSYKEWTRRWLYEVMPHKELIDMDSEEFESIPEPENYYTPGSIFTCLRCLHTFVMVENSLDYVECYCGMTYKYDAIRANLVRSALKLFNIDIKIPFLYV